MRTQRHALSALVSRGTMASGVAAVARGGTWPSVFGGLQRGLAPPAYRDQEICSSIQSRWLKESSPDHSPSNFSVVAEAAQTKLNSLR